MKVWVKGVIVTVIVAAFFSGIGMWWSVYITDTSKDTSQNTVENANQGIVNQGTIANSTITYNYVPEEENQQSTQSSLINKECQDQEIGLTLKSCLGFEITRPNLDWDFITNTNSFPEQLKDGKLGNNLLGIVLVTNQKNADIWIYVWDINDPIRNDLTWFRNSEIQGIINTYNITEVGAPEKVFPEATKAELEGFDATIPVEVILKFEIKNDKIYFFKSIFRDLKLFENAKTEHKQVFNSIKFGSD